MSPAEAGKLAAYLWAAYPAQTSRLPAEQAQRGLRAYALMLADLEHDVARAAVRELVETSQWLPTIAEVRQRAARAANGVDGALPAELAWLQVRAEVGRRGRYRSPQLECPFARAATAAIGWQSICDCPVEQEGVLRAQWRKAYEAAQRLAQERGLDALEAAIDPRQLSGLHERMERSRLLDSMQPNIARLIEGVVEDCVDPDGE